MEAGARALSSRKRKRTVADVDEDVEEDGNEDGGMFCIEFTVSVSIDITLIDR